MNIVCITSEFKGNPFIRRAKELGCRVTLVTKEKHRHDPWDWDCIDELHCTTDSPTKDEFIEIVTRLSRDRTFDRVCPLDEFEVVPAAIIREHLQIEGQSIDSALQFRDKLKMRISAQKGEILQPEFVGLFNGEKIKEYLESVEPPWIIKPRTEVAAFGIRKVHNVEEAWSNLAELDTRGTWRDHPSQYILEKFIAGNVYHIDSIVVGGKPIFSSVGTYGKPPLEVTHGGGVSSTRILHHDAKERVQLNKLNTKLIKTFGLEKGVTHAEFLQSAETGKFYLLEVASRVGGAYIADVLDAACGVNLWAEWASVDIANADNPYRLPETEKNYAAVAICLARQEFPDTSNYDDPEIIYRVNKPYHVGLLIKSASYDRITELLKGYYERFAEDFLAIAPAKEHFDDM